MMFRWFTQEEEAAFWAKSAPGPGECQLWTGATVKGGYGQYWWKRHSYAAPALAWMLTHKASIIPERKVHVMHSCDIPTCINPAHLSLGNDRLNSDDRIARPKRNAKNKLTLEKVVAMRLMRLDGAAYASIAHEFNVDFNTAYQAINRRTWKHVP